jgi:hypothetical protein
MVNRYFRKMKILIIWRKILSQNSSTQLKVNGLPGDKTNTSTNTKEIDDPAINLCTLPLHLLKHLDIRSSFCTHVTSLYNHKYIWRPSVRMLLHIIYIEIFMLILYLQLQPQQQHLQYQPIQRQVCMTKHNSENLNTSRFTDRDLHVYINGVTRDLNGG